MENKLPENFETISTRNDLLSELFPQLVITLNKDLNAAGIEKEFRIEKEDIFQLRTELTSLLKQQGGLTSERIAQLLYRVDVPQHKTARIIAETESNSIDQKIAEAIIIRELQKAWFRKNYSGKRESPTQE